MLHFVFRQSALAAFCFKREDISILGRHSRVKQLLTSLVVSQIADDDASCISFGVEPLVRYLEVCRVRLGVDLVSVSIWASTLAAKIADLLFKNSLALSGCGRLHFCCTG